MEHRATYSPDDNKLRLYPACRLNPETYAKVRAAGFIWAGKQELFVAPAWSPEREDLLIELAGEIEDEDTGLVDRAEERAERFEGYEEKRARESDQAQAFVQGTLHALNGQPVLIGHHSEKRHRALLERVDNAMGRSVKLWKTSQYWKSRAAGAIRHAKHKERPDVRARRIKGLEADARKMARRLDESGRFIKAWQLPMDRMRALRIATLDRGAGYGTWSDLNDEKITPAEAAERCIAAHQRVIDTSTRWAEHLANRLEYERAMLADAGGLATDRTGPEVGGGCKCWASPRGGWSFIEKVNKVSVTVLDNWGNGGPCFKRTIAFDKLSQLMTPDEVKALETAGRVRRTEDGTGFHVLPVTQEASHGQN